MQKTKTFSRHEPAMALMDAPALKESYIGIGMGGGSDLAKEIFDMIILDNNFCHKLLKPLLKVEEFSLILKNFIKFLVGAIFDEIFRHF